VDQMPGFRDECEKLAPLGSFDPEAFRGNDKVPQDVCNFVLTLALIYNDCKDGIYAHVVLAESKPDGPPQKDKVWGAFAGAQFHAFRAVASVLHEVCELIRGNEAILRDAFFCSVVRNLPSRSRKAWEALIDAAHEATPKDDLGKQLHRLRNKVTFHYDPKAMFIGYAAHFLGERKRDERAFVSRGIACDRRASSSQMRRQPGMFSRSLARIPPTKSRASSQISWTTSITA